MDARQAAIAELVAYHQSQNKEMDINRVRGEVRDYLLRAHGRTPDLRPLELAVMGIGTIHLVTYKNRAMRAGTSIRDMARTARSAPLRGPAAPPTTPPAAPDDEA
jgi:hypothetical protein